MIEPAVVPSTDLIGARFADDLRGQDTDEHLVINEARYRMQKTPTLLVSSL